MTDYGHAEADKELKKLEKDLKKLYAEAATDMQKKSVEFMKDFQRKDEQMKDLVAQGKWTEEQYDAWRRNQLLQEKRLQEMTDSLAKDLARTDQIAAGMINDTLPKAYAENFNYGTYEVEHGAGIDTGFTLYDKSTVQNLLKEDPKIIPQAKPDIPKDERWNRQKLTSAIAQGILQGESVPKIATRLQSVAKMDRNAAIRNARTYTTAAENKGRVDSIERANEMGIPADQEWLATLDDSTRMEHRHLDGQVRPVGEPFEADGYKILYPGDPSADPEMIYNCRCTLITRVRGRVYNDERNDSKLGGMSYEEWKHAKDRQMEPPEEPKPQHIIAEGKDISGTWERRPDKFDFEIDDVLNAQGFDGLPQIVTPEEFDKAVQEANGGQGFIAQRTYSAPDQETLDAYRESLYNGEWYVDCSTGGAKWGQGMYTAGNYEGQLTDEIKQEMKDYQGVNEAYTSHRLSDEERLQFAIDRLPEELKGNDDVLNYLKYGDNGSGEYSIRNSVKYAEIIKADLGSDNLLQVERIMANIPVNSAPPHYTETMTLDPSAKIITIKDLKKEFAEEYGIYEGTVKAGFNIYDTLPDIVEEIATKEEWAKLKEETKRLDYGKTLERYAKYMEAKGIPTDNGSYAALKGYDAIQTDAGTSGHDTIVLNRTKLIIKGD